MYMMIIVVMVPMMPYHCGTQRWLNHSMPKLQCFIPLGARISPSNSHFSQKSMTPNQQHFHEEDLEVQNSEHHPKPQFLTKQTKHARKWARWCATKRTGTALLRLRSKYSKCKNRSWNLALPSVIIKFPAFRLMTPCQSQKHEVELWHWLVRVLEHQVPALSDSLLVWDARKTQETLK